MATILTDEEREALLAEEAIARTEEARADQEHSDLCLKLRSQYRKELGKEGQAFELVNEANKGGVGPIVLKKGTAVASKVWEQKCAKTEGLPDEADQFQFIKDMVVFPERSVFGPIAVEYPQLRLACVAAAQRLYGFEAKVLRKK